MVKSLSREPGVQRVFNMTVEGEHVYYVSSLGSLVHNTNCGPEIPDKIYRSATRDNPNHVALREGESAVFFRDSLSNPLPTPGEQP
jgi:hypothetical protein